MQKKAEETQKDDRGIKSDKKRISLGIYINKKLKYTI